MAGFDSPWMKKDSNVINSTEYYKIGATVTNHTVTTQQRVHHPSFIQMDDYKVANDDYMVGGLAVMFFLMAMILFRNSTNIVYRIKDFFTSKRLYSGDIQTDNAKEALNAFVLTAISAMSVSIIYFDDIINQGHVYFNKDIPYVLFLAGFAVVLCFIYVKAWIYSLVNWVFFDHEKNRQWIRGYLMLTTLTAFLFYPIALVDVFSELHSKIAILCAILVVFLYECLLFYKFVINFRVKKYGYLLNFLYFCSVELFPLLVLGHWAVWISDNFIVKNLLY